MGLPEIGSDKKEWYGKFCPQFCSMSLEEQYVEMRVWPISRDFSELQTYWPIHPYWFLPISYWKVLHGLNVFKIYLYSCSTKMESKSFFRSLVPRCLEELPLTFQGPKDTENYRCSYPTETPHIEFSGAERVW